MIESVCLALLSLPELQLPSLIGEQPWLTLFTALHKYKVRSHQLVNALQASFKHLMDHTVTSEHVGILRLYGIAFPNRCGPVVGSGFQVTNGGVSTYLTHSSFNRTQRCCGSIVQQFQSSVSCLEVSPESINVSQHL